MALAFSNAKGKADSNKIERFEMKDGESRCRLVGGILARYVYWLPGTNGKSIPVECLSFDRELEKFTNTEVDHVPSFFPAVKCGWAYAINCIDSKDGKAKAFDLKKKLLDQVMDAAGDLGDPTDPDTGWELVIKRAKTGPNVFNVEYTLQVLKCKPMPLTEDQKVMVAKDKTIDQKYQRPTADDVMKTLVKITTKSEEDSEEAPADEAGAEAAKDL